MAIAWSRISSNVMAPSSAVWCFRQGIRNKSRIPLASYGATYHSKLQHVRILRQAGVDWCKIPATLWCYIQYRPVSMEEIYSMSTVGTLQGIAVREASRAPMKEQQQVEVTLTHGIVE